IIGFGITVAYENNVPLRALAQAIELQQPLRLGCTAYDESDMAITFLHCSKAALALADWTATPSIRVVQTLCINAWWIQHLDPKASLFEAGPASQQTRAMIALAHCKALGLDRLGSTEDSMPQADPAFAPGPSGLSRQLALRIWHSYTWLECLSGYITSDVLRATSIDPLLCDDDNLGMSLTVDQVAIEQRPSNVTLLFCLTTAKFRRKYLEYVDRGSISVSEAESLEGLTRSEMTLLRNKVKLMSEELVPVPMQNSFTFALITQIIEAASILRIRRFALRKFPDPFAPKVRALYLSTIDAANTLLSLLVMPAARQAYLALPASILYFLNAAIPLA
ncbi:hypothetical protein EMMF5_006593, partial [Cystobasidiomycetes sp. EMM_F5]